MDSSRCIICFMIFFAYFFAFMDKSARFSLLSVGYLMSLEQYFAPTEKAEKRVKKGQILTEDVRYSMVD